MKYDVFISYSSKDQKIAEGICGYLERNGCRCFVAYRDIPRGIVWAGAIADAIDESQMMVVVFSRDFNLSPQTDREIELAAENNIPILTYRITDDKFTGAKKYYLKNLNWIDAFPNPDHYFGKLLDSVTRLITKTIKEDKNKIDPKDLFHVYDIVLGVTKGSDIGIQECGEYKGCEIVCENGVVNKISVSTGTEAAQILFSVVWGESVDLSLLSFNYIWERLSSKGFKIELEPLIKVNPNMFYEITFEAILKMNNNLYEYNLYFYNSNVRMLNVGLEGMKNHTGTLSQIEVKMK